MRLLSLLLLLSTQQRRHVAGSMLLIQVVTTLLLCSTAATTTTSGSNATPTTYATHHTSAAPSPALSSTSTPSSSSANATATLAAVAAVATTATTHGSNGTAASVASAAGAAGLGEREVIGATSLAAAAGAAAAMADSVAMARSSSATSNDSQSGNSNRQRDSNSNSSNELLAKSANLLLEQLQQPTGHIVNLTRQHDGDVFRTSGVTTCNADTCVGLSSGTAGLVHLGGGDKRDSYQRGIAIGSLAGGGGGAAGADGPHQLELLGRRNDPATPLSRGVAASGESCQCRCLPYLSTYREDLGICVDDIHECTLSPFVSGSSSEKIPFVFLPLRGQIIYPSREISFPDIRTPVCAVTGAQYLTTNGWSDLRNPIDTDYPFRMFRDEGRTFLQWLGEPDLRQKMQGRLIVVHLVCRDMTITLNATAKEHFMPPKNVFSPCVAFRVNGTPVKYTHNVSEVLFQSEATSTLASTSDGMSTKEYVVIGVCSLLLGLIYVSSVFLYLHMKKRKNRDQSHMRNSLDDIANEINYPKNDQVTFGAPFHRSGSIYSATSLGTSNEPRSRTSIGSLKEEMGIVKNNPLLQHFPQLSDHHSGFASDVSNSNSECEMDGSFHDKLKQMQTAALVHPQLGMGSANGSPGGSPKSTNGNASGTDPIEASASPTQENECLPAENVSIVEDMMTEEKLEHLRAMVNGNVRRKLYFNPAYFEPHLLAQPPPAAVEFLEKIREVIAIAKYKMATKRYQPSLIVIPEEAPLRSNTPSLYSSQMQTTPTECTGCANNRCSGHIKNCGDKRNSIEKWLQTVTSTEQQKTAGSNGNGQQSENTDETSHADERQSSQESNNTRHQSPPKQTDSNSCAHRADSRSNRQPARKEVTPPKQRPPPPPTPTSSTNNKDRAESQTPSKSHVIAVTTNAASYQHYCTSVTTGPSVTIPISRNYESFSALSAAANIYGFAETGSEIYNNPKFTLHDSPAVSQRSHSSSHRSKSSRKRLDVLDQYAVASTPTSLTSAERQHYEMLRNMKQSPDMMYDAVNRDYTSPLTSQSGSRFQLDIPTPDYDSTMEKKMKDIYNNTQSSAPSVPTPDYSTLSRKSLKQFQPDSPIYRRKSPQYLIVDYETDSLERLEATKRKSSQSSSSPSSDVSSQLSPSLSIALPLEEELEISHTVYGKTDGFRREGEVKKRPVTKTDSNASKQKEIAARIKYDTPFRGSMTIEVEHEPPSDMERSTDSDQFEPDTLDRKPKKQSFCDVKAWSGQLKKIQNINSEASLSHTSFPNMSATESPPPIVGTGGTQSSFVLRSSNSFRGQNERNPTYESDVQMRAHRQPEEDGEHRPTFSSLREIYQSPLQRQNSQQSCKCGGQFNGQYETPDLEPLTEQGRLLTLEAKQKRRQQVINAPAPPPPIVEISTVTPNKTTIKITTPKVRRGISCDGKWQTEAAIVTPQVYNDHKCTSPTSSKSSALSNHPTLETNSNSCPSKGIYDLPKNAVAPSSPNRNNAYTPANTLNSTVSSKTSSVAAQKKRIGRSPPPLPPPPPPPTSASTTLTSQRSHTSSQHSQQPHYQNHQHYMHHSTTNTAEEETASNHSVSTEVTGVSDNVANSEFGGSCNNTLSSVAHISEKGKVDADQPAEIFGNSRDGSASNKVYEKGQFNSPQLGKKLRRDDADYGAMFNTHINGLRNDYSLTKYLNRRKSQDHGEEEQSSCNDADSQVEANNTLNARNGELDASKLDVLSISSRSNRSSSRLSDRTKEMYRNAGVPVGIAYPQRSSAGNNSASVPAPPPAAAATVQTVYRCEIEPVQLTHGMQIAMGLKDRAKKAKDLKNAWKKFVSMAAAKFSPTHSPAPPYDKKTPSFLEVLDRDEGISSLIEEHPRVSTPKSSYSAPASQNYYEQRFGPRGEMDSGYMSADSGEVYKRSFYDRYNFKMMSGRDHIIRVDTIEDNSDGGSSTLTDRHSGVAASARRSSILDSNRFEDFEHMGEPPENELTLSREEDNLSEADSDKTLTHTDERHGQRNAGTLNLYSSEDERGEQSPSYGSSETDGETNVEDMWESGAESIETHSVLYKNVRKN